MDEIPLLIEFAEPTALLVEPNRVSALPIVGNGPPGTFVLFRNGLRVPANRYEDSPQPTCRFGWSV